MLQHPEPERDHRGKDPVHKEIRGTLDQFRRIEILGPIDNPRYLLIRHGTVFGVKRKDYHAVPLRIGVRKEYAAIMHRAWLKYVGKEQLVYTRTKEASKTLLYARARAFSAGTKMAVKRMDRWV